MHKVVTPPDIIASIQAHVVVVVVVYNAEGDL